MSGPVLRRYVGVTTWFGIGCGPDWEEDVRRAFAQRGWTVTAIGPSGSSTHVEDDWIELRSDGRELEPAALGHLLTELGLTAGEYSLDLTGFGHKAATFVNGPWWDTCPDPRGLISVARDVAAQPWAYGGLKISDRKACLCACAAGRFCTRSWRGNAGPVLDILERYADGAASVDDLVAARDAALGRDADYPFGVTPVEYGLRPFWEEPFKLAHLIVHRALDDLRRTRAEEQSVGPRDAAWERISDGAKAEVAAVVRDVFGNPFHPEALDPAWLGWNEGTVPKLARAAYEEGRFEILPVLADALAEAGCDKAAMLSHCRTPGPHARGCWAVDLVLGKM
jgi:hypothetical protein